MDELNILKEEMAALKRNLDKEQIVNEKLMRTVMRQRASWLNAFVLFEFIMLPLLYLIFAVACAIFGISQWYAFAFVILGLVDAIVDLRTFRINPKIFSTCSMMEVRKILIKQKKERFVHLCVALPLALIWLLFFAMAVFNDGDSRSISYAGLWGGCIGGIIGAIIVIIIYRKAQKTNDTIVDDISIDDLP
ncbi:MAG: hypothetical protein K2K23_06170 [Muribaculaceae bacterium]|nr:hypothetical protein [Muribaculaceae bacterium]